MALAWGGPGNIQAHTRFGARMMAKNAFPSQKRNLDAGPLLEGKKKTTGKLQDEPETSSEGGVGTVRKKSPAHCS